MWSPAAGTIQKRQKHEPSKTKQHLATCRPRARKPVRDCWKQKWWALSHPYSWCEHRLSLQATRDPVFVFKRIKLFGWNGWIVWTAIPFELIEDNKVEEHCQSKNEERIKSWKRRKEWWFGKVGSNTRIDWWNNEIQ